MFFLIFDQKKKAKKTRKKNKKMQTLTHQLVPTWVLQFCLFCFLEFFLVFDQNKQKTGENQKKCRP